MISSYSFAMSVVFFNVSLAIVYMLRRKQDFIARYGIQTLMVITVMGFIRLVLPVDFEAAVVIRSYEFIPAIQEHLNYQIIDSGFDIGDILFSIWILGTVGFVIKDMLAIVRFKRTRDRYTRCEDAIISKVADELGIKHNVLITSCVSVPFVAGHFKQTIYVPPLDISEDEWKYVLMHEMQHIAAHDQLIKLMFLLLRSLFWWNPVSHLFIRELDAILELRCDAAVTSRLDDEGSLAYFTAMLSAIKKMLPSGEMTVTATSTLIGGTPETKSNTLQRFEVYRNSKKLRSKKVRNAIQVLLVLVFIASYFVIIQPAYYPPEEEILDTHKTADNTTFILTDGEKYWLFDNNNIIMEVSKEDMGNLPYSNFPVYNGGK